MKRKHDNYTKKTVATKVITTFLALILAFNNSIFKSKFYLQVKGCAVRPICAPTRNYVLVRREIHLIKKITVAISALSIIFLWYGPNQRTNLNSS